MQSYLYDLTYDTGSVEYQAYQTIMETLKYRFETYGYQQVRTSTFEDYDLYQSISGSVDRDNMVKVIDPLGKVMVMRPDVTIPLTRMAALSKTKDARLFYMLNVFRQYQDATELKERLQAGIERFGSHQAETDAEVITLAIHALKDLGWEQFKIEIGHAGFFKEVISDLGLTTNEKEQLQTLIQSKNLADIHPFLSSLNVSADIVHILQSIPLLYGEAEDVLKRVKNLPLTVAMQQKTDDLHQILNLLKAYGVTDFIVLDLGLINNMDYYSDVIFQGFITGYAKPVVMGGRYDQLASQFNKRLPAIGFAYDVGYLLEAKKQQTQPMSISKQVDITLRYEQSAQVNALQSANCLREAGYSVITHSTEKGGDLIENSRCLADVKQDHIVLHHHQMVRECADSNALLNELQDILGGA